MTPRVPDQERREVVERLTTLGDLCARDIDSTVTFTDGGATYTGELSKVDHSRGYKSASTMVVLVAADWRHIKSYPSETECHVAALLGSATTEEGA